VIEDEKANPAIAERGNNKNYEAKDLPDRNLLF
jgi:hypothetical protein